MKTGMNKGRIVQVMGPVVDVVFEDGNLPRIKDALQVENNGKTCIIIPVDENVVVNGIDVNPQCS